MTQEYVNPSKHLGQLDEKTFKNIEKLHQEYLEKALEDVKCCDENNPQYISTLIRLINIQNDFSDFYIKNKKIDDAIDKLLSNLEYIKIIIGVDVEKYINILELTKAKLCGLYSWKREYDKIINLNEYYYDYFSEFPLSNDNFKKHLLSISKVNLGRAYYDSGKFEISEKHYDEALNLIEKSPKNIEYLINIYISKARIYGRKGLIDEANSTYQFVIDEIKETNNPGLKSRLVDIKNEYAELLFRNKQNDEALNIFLDIYTEISKNNQMNLPQANFYTNVLFKIGKIYEFKKDPERSNEFLNKGIEVASNIQGFNKEILVDYRAVVANNYVLLKDFASAVGMFETNIQYIKSKQTLTIREKEFLCQMLLRLTIAYDNLNDNKKAFVTCKEAYELSKSLKESGSNMIINIYLDLKNSLSNIYFANKDFSNSEKLCLELLDEISERKVPATKEFSASVLERLIKIYSNASYLEQLRECYVKLLEIYYSLNHANKYINTIERFVQVLVKEKEYNEALTWLEKVLEYVNGNINDEKDISHINAITLRKIISILINAKNESILLEKPYNLEEIFSRAEGEYKNLMKIDYIRYMTNFYDLYTEWENLLLKEKKFEEMSNITKKKLEMLSYYKLDSEEYKLMIALTKERVGIALTFMNRLEEAENYYLDAISSLEEINENGKHNDKLDKMKNNYALYEKIKNNL